MRVSTKRDEAANLERKGDARSSCGDPTGTSCVSVSAVKHCRCCITASPIHRHEECRCFRRHQSPHAARGTRAKMEGICGACLTVHYLFDSTHIRLARAHTYSIWMWAPGRRGALNPTHSITHTLVNASHHAPHDPFVTQCRVLLRQVGPGHSSKRTRHHHAHGVAPPIPTAATPTTKPANRQRQGRAKQPTAAKPTATQQPGSPALPADVCCMRLWYMCACASARLPAS